MSEEKRIVMPGDPKWNKHMDFDKEYQTTPKMPSNVLEAAFTDAVKDAQNMIAEGAPVDQSNSLPVEVDKGTVEQELAVSGSSNSYKYPRPAQKKFIEVPIGKPLDAILLENLPRRWERVCFRKFRKGDHITLIGMTYFPGVGALYEFEEGKRGSFGVRPDQVSFPDPEVAPMAPLVSNNEETLRVEGS
jgi:hypothetical protein